MKYQEIEDGEYVKVHIPGTTPWQGQIISKKPTSYTKVIVKDIERGPGWDHNSQSYKGYYPKGKGIVGGPWGRGQNSDFGKEFEIHIKYLILI